MPDRPTASAETAEDLIFELIHKAERLADAGRNITVATPETMTRRAEEVHAAIAEWNDIRARALAPILGALKERTP